MTRLYETLWAGLLAMLPGSDLDLPPVFPGYVEGEYVYVAPESSGRITGISVLEGDQVQVGEILFALDDRLETEAVNAAIARVDAAQAALENLRTGARPDELAVTNAALAQALSSLDLAGKTLERSKSLLARNNISSAQVDIDRAQMTGAQGAVDQLRAELVVQQMPAREGEIALAKANLAAAKSDARRLEIVVQQRTTFAPVNGRIEKLFFVPGELASPATPVLSILPEQGRIVRFYVPQGQRASLTTGMTLPVTCDGCPTDLTAIFTWIATDPEFTPPIIFSREERGRLVYLAEARLPLDSTLSPGQPVTIELPK